MIITFAGPPAAGKGTLAQMLAKTLQLPHYDIGLMFRKIAQLGQSMTRKDIEKLDQFDLSDESLMNEQVGMLAAIFSRVHGQWINALVQNRIKDKSFVCDGRTCGIEIFTKADLKFYIVADYQTRCRRRGAELANREAVDRAKLVVPDGAVIIDTSGRSVNESLQEILRHARNNK